MLTAWVTSTLQFGQIDIYLFDQLLRGRLRPGMRVRRRRVRLRAATSSTSCGRATKMFGARFGRRCHRGGPRPCRCTLAPPAAAGRIPGRGGRRDVVSGRVRGRGAGSASVASPATTAASRPWSTEMWRVLRLKAACCSAGWRPRSAWKRASCQTAGRRFLLPDGIAAQSRRTKPCSVELTRRLGGAFLDPLKTTIVQNQRCMTTWVVRRALDREGAGPWRDGLAADDSGDLGRGVHSKTSLASRRFGRPVILDDARSSATPASSAQDRHRAGSRLPALFFLRRS